MINQECLSTKHFGAKYSFIGGFGIKFGNYIEYSTNKKRKDNKE